MHATLRSHSAVESVVVYQGTVPAAAAMCLEDVDKLNGVFDIPFVVCSLHRYYIINDHV